MSKISVIVSVYNEEKVLPVYYQSARETLEKMGEDYELIFINDGSRDATKRILDELAAVDVRVKVVHFARNFGQQAGFYCGIQHASGDAVITMDVDLQDPPSLMLQMLEKWREGYEIVHTHRKKRLGETAFKRFTAGMFYKFTRKITGLDLPQEVGNYKLLDRKVVDYLKDMGEHDRFWCSQIAWLGFSQTTIDFERPARAAGETKYTTKKLVKIAASGIFPNTDYPLTLSLKCGIVGAIASLLCFITFIVLTCLQIPFGGLVAWLFPCVGLVGSLIMLGQGVSNIYLYMTYKETQNRPNYVVSEKINF